MNPNAHCRKEKERELVEDSGLLLPTLCPPITPILEVYGA